MNDQFYMMRCLELAAQGYGHVHPNPMVGCVIVKNGRVVAEGYHARFGNVHAEVAALKKAGKDARGATLYVNLEPCVHQGKTPPCVNAIMAAGIRRVVIATRDPNPLVSGRGIRTLRSAGIQVTHGLMKREAEELNERFFLFMRKKRPFVAIKVAQTLDGKIADKWGKSKWITSPDARAYGHALRSTFDAIMVGMGTVRKDDPLLTIRAVRGRQPLRVVLDGAFAVSPKSRILQQRFGPSLVVTSTRSLRRNIAKASKLERAGVSVIGIQGKATLKIQDVLRVLAGMNISSVLVEGGAKTIAAFLDKNVADRLYCFIAPKIVGGGLQGLVVRPRGIKSPLAVQNTRCIMLGPDILLEGTLS